MTLESELAKNNALQFEAKLDGLRKNQDGTVKLTFTVHPEEFPARFMSDKMGQRYMVVSVAINDDETPLVPASQGNAEVKGIPKAGVAPYSSAQGGDKPKTFAGQSKMMAFEPRFCQYAREIKGFDTHPDMSVNAELYIESCCNVKSCSEIIEGTEAGRKFKQLQAQYLSWRDNVDQR